MCSGGRDCDGRTPWKDIRQGLRGRCGDGGAAGGYMAHCCCRLLLICLTLAGVAGVRSSRFYRYSMPYPSG